MNLITETKYKLNYYKQHLEELEGCLRCTNTEHLTKDCIHYINDEVTKAKKNIEYYEGILKVLEEK